MSSGTDVMTREQAQKLQGEIREAAPEGKGVARAFMEELEPRWRLCKALASSGMIPQRTPEAALAVMLKGFELGVPPMQAFGSIHYFDGKLTIEASLMDAVAVQRLGVRKEILEWTDQVCRIRFSRPDREPVESEFTIEEAKTAGLLRKDNWKKYPKDMLAARAKARGLRMIAPDLFSGMLAQEETSYRFAQDEDIPAEGPASEVEESQGEAPQEGADAPSDGEEEAGSTGGGAGEADSERERLNRKYFATLNEKRPSWGDVERKFWQEQKIGKASCKDWDIEDYKLALLLIRRGQLDVDVSEFGNGDAPEPEDQEALDV